MSRADSSQPSERTGQLSSLTPGQIVPFGGNRYTVVDVDLAERFQSGDRLVVVQESGDLLHVPADVAELVDVAVGRAVDAFRLLAGVDSSAIDEFYDVFARRLDDEKIFASIESANQLDVADARSRGRAVGRLELSAKMRSDMIVALHMWRDLPGVSGVPVARIEHSEWTVEERRSALGVVGFVFEGRPNVFADATGVLKSGNTVVFRIGSDALRTARAIMEGAVIPALAAAGLPTGAVVLVDSAERSAGHALFSDRRLALAVARGSGEAVAQLGAVARQSGVPVSLHGTGGAWMHVADDADPTRVASIVDASLDRKVCNTVNVIAVPGDRRDLHVVVFDGVRRAARRRGVSAVVHLNRVDQEFWSAAGELDELVVRTHDDDAHLAIEWEWDDVPEVSIVRVDGIDTTLALFERHSPHFILSVLSPNDDLVEYAYRSVDAPFVGDGFTRWVDGQYALGRPELGLSNWENGRLFARGGILSGDGVFTVRYRTRHRDAEQRR